METGVNIKLGTTFTDQIKKLSTFKMLQRYFKVYEFFSVCSGQL